jgi:undecaprenyl-phosphate alpha-N-acetylglucosaminyl 1-phosphatetransferase
MVRCGYNNHKNTRQTMSQAVFFGIGLLVSAVFIRLGISVAQSFGVMDRPGGHKQHDTSTPFVGGVGVMSALICSIYLTRAYDPTLSIAPFPEIALGASVIFLIGLADDIWQLNFRTRFAFQSVVALYMIFSGGVVLNDLGELFPGYGIELGLLAVPFTVFGTIGVINALNMIDGIDGLSGTISLVSLVLTALLAYMAGDSAHFMLILTLAGGVAGFLYFNLRYPGNARAKVFLGDNGSMLLGFLFAWILIDMSQGENRAMTPATALWIFSLPLMDTVAVMLRRIWMKKSPFRADRNHLHHLFLRAGFRVSDTVKMLALLQLMAGLFGIVGFWLQVPDWLMFGGFLLSFAGYFYVTARPWRFVPSLISLHTYLGLPSNQARGVYIGYVKRNDAPILTDMLVSELGDRYEYRFSLHEIDADKRDGRSVYGILELSMDHDDSTLGEIKHLINRLKIRLANLNGIQVRQFLQRNIENDRRSRKISIPTPSARNADRRTGSKALIKVHERQSKQTTHHGHTLPV